MPQAGFLYSQQNSSFDCTSCIDCLQCHSDTQRGCETCKDVTNYHTTGKDDSACDQCCDDESCTQIDNCSMCIQAKKDHQKDHQKVQSHLKSVDGSREPTVPLELDVIIQPKESGIRSTGGSFKSADSNEQVTNNSQVLIHSFEIPEEYHHPHSTTKDQFPSQDTFTDKDIPEILYCHWDNHDQNEETRFTKREELDRHLREHLESLIAAEPANMDSITSGKTSITSTPATNRTNSTASNATSINTDSSISQPAQSSQSLTCHWDSCHIASDALDDIYNHIIADHFESVTLPHDKCPVADEYCYPTGSGNGHNNNHNHNHLDPDPRSGSGTDFDIVGDLTPREQLQCDYKDCDFIAPSNTLYDDHLREIHGLMTKPLSPPLSSRRPSSTYECEWPSCSFASTNQFDLSNHMVEIHRSPATPDHEEIKKRNLLKRTLSVMEQQQQPYSKRPKDTTQNNSQTSSEISSVCKWIDNTTNGQPCGCTFANPAELTAHVVACHVGSNKKTYTCMWQDCGRNHKPFDQKQKVIRHLNIHTNNKRYKCDLCGRAFVEENLLKQHLRTHSGEKPYECNICHKRFAAATALSVHIRTHTGEKPLVCKYPNCEKRFSESSNLSKHMKTHYKDNKYVCTCCQKQFNNPEKLKVHLQGHIEEINMMNVKLTGPAHGAQLSNIK